MSAGLVLFRKAPSRDETTNIPHMCLNSQMRSPSVDLWGSLCYSRKFRWLRLNILQSGVSCRASAGDLVIDNILCTWMEDNIHSGFALGSSTLLLQGFVTPEFVCIHLPSVPISSRVQLVLGSWS